MGRFLNAEVRGGSRKGTQSVFEGFEGFEGLFGVLRVQSYVTRSWI